jgi:hypothetical protein
VIVETRGLAEDTTLRDQCRLAVEGEWTAEAVELKKRLDTPYTQRSWAKEVAERAMRETEAKLAASPGVRTVGKIVGDFKSQQERWEDSKVVVEGQ